MTSSKGPAKVPATHRRADARRSRAAILDAAVPLLNAVPDASVESIATEARVTRQTVYAHFPSRDQLLAAVVERITEESVAAMEAADPDAGPASGALFRVLDASARTAGRYPVLVQRIADLYTGPDAERARHAPVADLLQRVVRRGQRSGEFDTGLSPDWLGVVIVQLAHAASREIDAGRMDAEGARAALHTSLLRILTGGATGAGN